MVITCIIGLSQSKSTTSRYLLSVIDHLTATETGVRNCVFYGLRPDSALEEVLQDLQLELIPKWVYTARRKIPVDVDRIPSEHLLFMVDGTDISSDLFRMVDVFNATNPSTRLLVLIDTISGDYRVLERLLRQWSFSNVVYLDEKRHRMILADTVKRVRIGYLTPPWELYNGSLMRSMQGHPITFACRSPMSTESPDFRWLEETVAFMNTSLQESVHNCSRLRLSLDNSCYLDHIQLKRVDVDMSDYSIVGTGTRTFWMLCLGVSNGMVILVPRSQLTITQLFTFPLNWEVWLLLVVLLGVLETIKLLFPTLLRNDPVLLAVCGFQQYDLHKAGLWEKTILFPAIVILFFTSCAYETKLLSMMISKPATQQIDTMEELLQSGIKVKVNFLKHRGMLNDSILSPIFVNSSDSVFVMDKIHAYVANRVLAELAAPMYYDREQRLYRYAIMDQTFGTWLKIFMLSQRDPFLNILGKIHATLVESGIMKRWESQIQDSGRKFMSAYTDCLTDSLNFVDLIPAWILYGLGSVLSAVLFVCESFSQVLKRYKVK